MQFLNLASFFSRALRLPFFFSEHSNVAPAGVERENTGHHHLLIDIEPEALDLDQALPADDNVKHFGGGQTETVLELTPGPHTLQLVLGDAYHVPLDPPVASAQITVTVK